MDTRRERQMVTGIGPGDIEPFGVGEHVRVAIRAAEQQMIAANAEIGVAKAAYFPQITLSGAAGFETTALSSLFSGPAGEWTYGINLVQPIFTAGRIRSNVRFAEAQQQATLLTYRQTIQGAFRDVSNALIANLFFHLFDSPEF